MTEYVAVEPENDAYLGQAGYTRRLLPFYDLFVMNYTLPVLWRCSKKRLRRLYDEHVGARHLDIGVASGYLLDKCHFPSKEPEITLMDLNPDSLRYAARRIRRYSPATHQANVLRPWGVPEHAFDSVAMANLLHCVPGTLHEKAPVAFAHARDALAPGGTLLGVTILGLEADHTKRSKRALKHWNDRGGFSNLEDRREDLEAALSNAFSTYEVEVTGAAALFVAKHAE